MRNSIERHAETELEDRKLLHHLIAPSFTEAIETSREVRRIVFGKSSATIVPFIDTPRTHLHEIDFSLHASFQNDDRTRDITPQRFHLVVLTPVDIRSPCFSG